MCDNGGVLRVGRSGGRLLFLLLIGVVTVG